MITLIDYGLGNLRAFSNVYKRIGIPVKFARSKEDLDVATKLILPGVGSFDHAMQQFNESGMRDKVTEMVLQESIPILGICVGMQMLARSSEEGVLPGLGWIEGDVKKFISTSTPGLQLPHMGWNDVKSIKQHSIFLGLTEAPLFYFLHSYFFECQHIEHTLATSEYGQEFTCAVNYKNIYGVQFHPEKSHNSGSILLKNFAEL